MHGLSRSLIANMVQGVNEGFVKKLEIHGVGFKGAVQGRVLELNLGYSHTIKHAIPHQVEVKVEGNTNITMHSFQTAKDGFDTGDVRAYMTTIPEVEYLLSELERRNISQRFGGLFLHDDTVTQVS